MDLSVMDKINEAGVALTPHLFRLVLKGMAWRARLDPGFRENLYDFDTGSPMPWQARINFLTKGRNDGFHVVIDGGRIRTGNGLAGSADVTFNFRDLASEARRLSANEDDSTRSDGLGRLAGICEKVPAEPADTLHEALQSIWVTFVGGHMENTNTALSLGRLDRLFGEMEHYRSGRYNVGFWSMSHHVAFGVLSGALPSGRRAFEPFTPGITQSAAARAVLTEQIKTVASLDAVNMPNNMAFNVKVVPHPKDSFSQTVDQMSAYTRSYVELGGMQMQYNVMDTETMRRAMEHPEQYRDLMVRISGYNAYFVKLDPSIQLELINRAEHGLGSFHPTGRKRGSRSNES